VDFGRGFTFGEAAGRAWGIMESFRKGYGK
jgi:hypothetical protein